MKVLVAMSGGVDSSVAAARLVAAGHDVTGVTMKLWGGQSDTGCCSVADVEDARWAARALGIDHLVFNFGDDFDRHVVDHYVAEHVAGRTPNPCIECNRHLKFDRLLARAGTLGFDAVATGHHARIVEADDGTLRIARGADRAKDQSYVLYMLRRRQLAKILLPIGGMTTREVRAEAERLGLGTATKPDSQDVCFITASAGRETFLADRIPLHRAEVVDTHGNDVGHLDSIEMVTVGQRKGLGLAGSAQPRYVVDVDPVSSRVTVGTRSDLLVDDLRLRNFVWASHPVTGRVQAQTSAHGTPQLGEVVTLDHSAASSIDEAPDVDVIVRWSEPQRRVAPGQSVVLYEGDSVLGGGIAI